MSSTTAGMVEIVDSTGSFSASRLQPDAATLLQTSPATSVQDTVWEASQGVPVPIQSAAYRGRATIATNSCDGLFDGGDDSDKQLVQEGERHRQQPHLH